MAAARGYADVVNLLIEKKANVNAVGKVRSRPCAEGREQRHAAMEPA
jgi:hypothetical protein